MQDLLEYVVKNLVNKPEAVSVQTENQGESTIALNLTVDPEDMGLIIGKGGQTIRAIRKLIGVRAMMENVRVYINLVEPEGSERPQVEKGTEDTNVTEETNDAEAQDTDQEENPDAPVVSEESLNEAPMPESAEVAAEVLVEAPETAPQESDQDSEEQNS